MPSQNTKLASVNDAVIFLDSSIASDTLRINKQINISASNWKLSGASNQLDIKRDDICHTYFSTPDGLTASKFSTPTAQLSSTWINDVSSSIVLNSQMEVHNSFGIKSTIYSDGLIEPGVLYSKSGNYILRYTYDVGTNTSPINLLQHTSAASNPNAFTSVFTATLTGTSSLQSVQWTADFDFKYMFALLPFHTYNSVANIGVVRVYKRSGSTIALSQTIGDATFNMSHVIVSANGVYLLITSGTSTASHIQVWKLNKNTTQYSLYWSRTISDDTAYYRSVNALDISRDGSRLLFRGKNVGGNSRAFVYTITTLDIYKFNQTFVPIGEDDSSDNAEYGLFNPTANEVVITNGTTNDTYVYEIINTSWIDKQKITESFGHSLAYNGQYIMSINTDITGTTDWNIYGRKHSGTYALVHRDDFTGGGVAFGAFITDDDKIYFLRFTAFSDIGLLMPSGASLGGMTQTKSIQITQPYAIAPASNIGSATSVYKDIFSLNAITVTSDRRLKRHIRIITSNAAMEIVKNLQPVSYTWRHTNDQTYHHGFIAHNVDNKNPKNLKYDELIPLLVGAINNMSARINMLKETKS